MKSAYVSASQSWLHVGLPEELIYVTAMNNYIKAPGGRTQVGLKTHGNLTHSQGWESPPHIKMLFISSFFEIMLLRLDQLHFTIS